MSAPAAIGTRRQYAREHFRGLENLLAPSFDPDLRRLDERALRLDVRQSIQHGCFATACALDAGLSPAERRRMVDVAVDEAHDRIAIAIAPGALPLAEVRALAAHAASVGARLLHLAFAQDFAPRSDDEYVDYVRRVADCSELAVSIVASERTAFHALHPSGVPLAALERLADHDAIVGLELGSLDAGLILECCERFAGRWLVSSPHLSLQPMLCANFAVQCSGPWPVEALQSPGHRHATDFMAQLACGDAAAAMHTYWALAPALGTAARVSQSFAYTSAQHWPLVKYQQWLSGGNGGLTRQPVMRMFQRDMQLVRAGLAAVGVECAEPDEAFFRGRSAQSAA